MPLYSEIDMALALTCAAARTMTDLPVEHVDSELVPCWAIHSAESDKGWRYIVATCTRVFAMIEGVRFQFAEYEGTVVADRLLEDLPYSPDAIEWHWNGVLLAREKEAL